MRGGFVACLAVSRTVSTRLEPAASHLTWHHGKPSFHRHGGFQVAWLRDDEHGPTVEVHHGQLLLAHGASPQPLELLAQHDRFVGVESDGVTLRAIRDPFGEIPLFYRQLGGEFWLATEIQPLLVIAPTRVDHPWLAAYSASVQGADGTGWLGIKRALPGELLEVDRHLSARRHRFFAPRVATSRERRSPTETAQEFRVLFSKAVEKCATERCGVLLSGGLDSSAVAVIAARTGRPTLLSIHHEGLPEVDEGEYAAEVADTARVPLLTLAVEPEPWDPADDLRMFRAPPIVLPTDMYPKGLAALAAAGCDTALDGHDGDGLLGNQYAWVANTLLDARVDRLARAAREFGLGFILKRLAHDVVPPPAWRGLRRSTSPPDRRATLLPYFRGQTRRALLEETRWQAPRRGWRSAQLGAVTPPKTQVVEEIELLGARAGIDVRHPFADRELVTFVAGLSHRVLGVVDAAEAAAQSGSRRFAPAAHLRARGQDSVCSGRRHARRLRRLLRVRSRLRDQIRGHRL